MFDIIRKLREHPQIGNGSCHPWDECYTDEELQAHLNSMGVRTYDQAVKRGLELLEIWDDRFADARNSAF